MVDVTPKAAWDLSGCSADERKLYSREFPDDDELAALAARRENKARREMQTCTEMNSPVWGYAILPLTALSMGDSDTFRLDESLPKWRKKIGQGCVWSVR